MRTEKVVLSIIAVIIGLLVAGAAFYFYQSTKILAPNADKTLAVKTPTPSPTPIPDSLVLSIENPVDESVVANKTIKITGKAATNAIVLISTPIDDTIASPSSTGDFSTTAMIDNGENPIVITAIEPNGSEVTKKLTVTYSTESF